MKGAGKDFKGVEFNSRQVKIRENKIKIKIIFLKN